MMLCHSSISRIHFCNQVSLVSLVAVCCISQVLLITIFERLDLVAKLIVEICSFALRVSGNYPPTWSVFNECLNLQLFVERVDGFRTAFLPPSSATSTSLSHSLTIVCFFVL
mmetsp:Transcript_30031/g.46839  ORF Transcript_30031/g.46839 Transcript_30031/m.46839 type:complete len:112 (+) Transcript_30031:176-511(+)